MTRLKPLGDCQTDVSKEQGYSFSVTETPKTGTGTLTRSKTHIQTHQRHTSCDARASPAWSCPSCHNQNWLTHVDPEQNNYDRNLCGTVPKEIQPSQWLYAKPNPKHKHSDYCYSCSLLTIESYESDVYSFKPWTSLVKAELRNKGLETYCFIYCFWYHT